MIYISILPMDVPYYKSIKNLSDLDEFKDEYVVMISFDRVSLYDTENAFMLYRQNLEGLEIVTFKKFGIKGHAKYKSITNANLSDSAYCVRRMGTDEMVTLSNRMIENSLRTDHDEFEKLQAIIFHDELEKLQAAIKRRPQLQQ